MLDIFCPPIMLIQTYRNVVDSRITFNEKLIKSLMKDQHIRRTKLNIQVCKDELIEHVKKSLSNEWEVFYDLNGEFSFKCAS